MSHFTRERSDADWYRGLKVPHTVVRNIDEKTKKAISASGGTWVPAAPIIIGGAGLELQCLMTTAGAPTIFPAVGKNYYFGDDDYFQYDSAQSRTIVECPLLLLDVLSWPRESIIEGGGFGGTTATLPSMRTRRAGAKVRLPLRIPDGARLVGVDVKFSVSTGHPASVPAQLPRARVVRMSGDGVISEYPNPTTATVEPGGWVSPARPASSVAWINGGAVQTLSLTYHATLQPRVDRTVYDYALEWIEEKGLGAFTGDGNTIWQVNMNITQLDLRPY